MPISIVKMTGPAVNKTFSRFLTSRQTHEKLQCLCENLKTNNFCKTAVLKKNMNRKLKLHSSKDSTEKN